jgi:hypothetical protein
MSRVHGALQRDCDDHRLRHAGVGVDTSSAMVPSNDRSADSKGITASYNLASHGRRSARRIAGAEKELQNRILGEP